VTVFRFGGSHPRLATPSRRTQPKARAKRFEVMVYRLSHALLEQCVRTLSVPDSVVCRLRAKPLGRGSLPSLGRRRSTERRRVSRAPESRAKRRAPPMGETRLRSHFEVPWRRRRARVPSCPKSPLRSKRAKAELPQALPVAAPPVWK